MEDLERRVERLELKSDRHTQALYGDNREAGLLERMRTIEKSRLLFWLLVGNIAAMVGHAFLQFVWK